MSLSNFHAVRIHDQGDFVRIRVLKTLPNGVMVLGGPLKNKPDDGTKPQAYRFPKDKFTVSEAKRWLDDQEIKYKTFEPAEGKASETTEGIEQRFIEPVEMRITRDGDKPPILEGYAAVFNKLTKQLFGFREKIAPGAFKKTLRDKDDVRALIDHDHARIIGRRSAKTLRIKEDDKGLHYEIDLPDTTCGRDIAVSVERGDISVSSFAFRCTKDSWVHKKDEEIRTIEEVELIDISPVTYPAYTDTSVALRSLKKRQEEIKEGLKYLFVMDMELRSKEAELQLTD